MRGADAMMVAQSAVPVALLSTAQFSLCRAQNKSPKAASRESDQYELGAVFEGKFLSSRNGEALATVASVAPVQ